MGYNIFMKYLFLALLLMNFVSYDLYANDAWVEAAGGSYRIMGEKNANIQMIREEIEINMYNDYYEMRIFFVFRNSGDDVILNVGFPEYSYGTQTIAEFSNFRSSINDNWVTVEKVNNDYNNNSWIKINSWYVKQVEFRANSIVTSIVEYRAQYANSGPFNSVQYLYGTGGTWKDTIGEIKIQIKNHTDYWIRSFYSGITSSIKINNRDNIILIEALNVTPENYDTFSVTFGSEPLFMNYLDSSFVLNREIIKPENLILLTHEQLRLLRNSIYANHGYIFRSQDLIEYFDRFRLHKSNASFSENEFSEIERANLENIINQENRRKK